MTITSRLQSLENKKPKLAAGNAKPLFEQLLQQIADRVISPVTRRSNGFTGPGSHREGHKTIPLAIPFPRWKSKKCRAGELLKQIEPGQGARDGKREAGDHPPLRSEMARDAGMSPHQAKQAVRVANVEEQVFEAQVESPKPPTLSALASQGIQRRVTPPPDPQTWLKGRDKKAFNRALHFTGDITDYAVTARAERIWDGRNET